MTPSEQTLRDRFTAAIKAAIEECKELGYTPTRFIQMLEGQHAVEAVKKLVVNGPSDGLERIVKLGKLHLAVESIMLREEFEPLFTPDELKAAKWNLDYAEGNLPQQR